MRQTKLVLSTKEGQATLTTQKFTGKLNSIVIRSPEKVEVIIESELGYIVYHNRMLYGTNYLPVRSRTVASIESLMDHPEFVEYLLNEKLLITVIGMKDVDVEFIFRFV